MKRKKVPTLLVLGAGASIGARRYPIDSSLSQLFSEMPSSRNFFVDLSRESLRPGKPRRFLNHFGIMDPGPTRLIRDAWGLSKRDVGFDPEEWRGVDIEEVFTFLDIGTRMYGRGTTWSRGFKSSRDSLIQHIVVSLIQRAHGQHCEHLSELLYGMRSADSIISFNYDTIADYTLQHSKSPQLRTYLKLMSTRAPTVKEFGRRGILLKLHGSVNWLVCVNRKCSSHGVPRIVQRGRHKALPKGWSDALSECDICGHERPNAGIVPPMAQKSLEKNGFFHRLWLIAREQPPRFRRIIFVGYSFPPADGYSAWLFRQLRFARTRKPEIVVVNPEVLQARHPVRARYDSLFRGFRMSRYGTLESFIGGPWRGLA